MQVGWTSNPIAIREHNHANDRKSNYINSRVVKYMLP